MMLAKNDYPIRVRQLQQLVTCCRDGDLISSDARKELVNLGLVSQYNGWNFLTTKGIQYLSDMGLIIP